MNSDTNLLEAQTAADNAPTEVPASTLADISLPTPPTTMKEANLKACSSEGDMVSLNPYWLSGLDEKVRAKYFPGLTEFNGKVALINDNNAGDSKIGAKYYCYSHDMGGVLKRHTNVVHIQQNDAAEDGFYHTMYFNDDSTSSGPASPAITTTSDTIINENLQITTKNYFPTRTTIREYVVKKDTPGTYNVSFQGVLQDGGEGSDSVLPPVILCKRPPQGTYYFEMRDYQEYDYQDGGIWTSSNTDALQVIFYIYGNREATNEQIATFKSGFKTYNDFKQGNSFDFGAAGSVLLNIEKDYNYIYIRQKVAKKIYGKDPEILSAPLAYLCNHINYMSIILYRETFYTPQTQTTYTYTTNPLNYPDTMMDDGIHYRSVANDLTAFNIETRVLDTSLKKLLTAGRIISRDITEDALQIRRNSIQDATLTWERKAGTNFITLNFTCRDNWYEGKNLAIHMTTSFKNPAIGTIYITAPTPVFDSGTNTYKYSIMTQPGTDADHIYFRLKDVSSRRFWIQPVDDTSMIKLPTAKFGESRFLIS